jgi:tetratricopeptide (TPR) repeat protein
MILPLLLALQVTPAGVAPAPFVAPAMPGPQTSDEARFNHCVDLATDDPGKAETEASAWRLGGGKFLARQCLGMAYSREGRWALAADEFAQAARDAEIAKDNRAVNYWAQSGNAWLAAGDAAKARSALDAALSAGTLSGMYLGEVRLDRARAMVADNDLASARDDLDRALTLVPKDPLAWLLSATLARKMNDLHRAQVDIAQTLKLSPDDASVQLEAGNIAALSGKEDEAKEAWGNAARIAPATPVGKAAKAALGQFGAAKP